MANRNNTPSQGTANEYNSTNKTQINTTVPESQDRISILTQELLYRTPLKKRRHSSNERIRLSFEEFDNSVRTCIGENDCILHDAANALVQVTSEVYLEQGIKEGLLLMSDALSSLSHTTNANDFSNYISMYNLLFHRINDVISVMEENRDCHTEDVIAYLRQAQEEALDIKLR